MDSRCIKFWEDGQELLQVATSDAARRARALGKILKELRTMSRFLQKNQSQRFSDAAQQKITEAVGAYVTFCRPLRSPSADEQQLIDAVFQVVKDGLAMPFNVFGTKQKKRLMKWYNELIGVVGGDVERLEMDGLEGSGDATAPPTIEWSVLDMDADGYLSLLNDETGETCESFQVPKKTPEYKQVKKALADDAEVVVVTVGDEVQDVRVTEAS